MPKRPCFTRYFKLSPQIELAGIRASTQGVDLLQRFPYQGSKAQDLSTSTRDDSWNSTRGPSLYIEDYTPSSHTITLKAGPSKYEWNPILQ